VIFDKADVKRWRRTVHKELRRIRLPPDDAAYPAAMICAAIYCFGTDVAVLAEVSGQPEAAVKPTLKRLRQQRALSGQTLRVAWNDEKTGGFALLLDAMVAAGDLIRPVDEKRSAAHKGKHSGPRKPRQPGQASEPGAPFRPKVTNSNPLYYLDETKPERKR
jgi:hypothetical protein